MRALVVLLLSALAGAVAAAAGGAGDLVRAQLTARRSAVISAEVSARVSRVLVQEGARFKAGEVLVAFDDTTQRAQLERAEAILAGAEKTAAANDRLVALQSAGQLEAAQAEAELRKARTEVAFARAMLARCEIRAPYDGRVAEQRIREEEFVQPGQAVLEIIDDAVPQVDFIAPSKWLAWLRPGQQVTLRVEETGRDYVATVERIGARVDPVSQTVKVVAGIDGAHPELMAGMSGTIAVPATP